MHGTGPDAEMMCRFFESAVKCMVLFDSSRDQGREQKEVMEVFSSTLVQTELIIFQEVIEHRMEFFFTELIRVSIRGYGLSADADQLLLHPEPRAPRHPANATV